jgi:hypothetical protein
MHDFGNVAGLRPIGNTARLRSIGMRRSTMGKLELATDCRQAPAGRPSEPHYRLIRPLYCAELALISPVWRERWSGNATFMSVHGKRAWEAAIRGQSLGCRAVRRRAIPRGVLAGFYAR